MSKYFTESELSCKCCGGLPEGGFPDRLFKMLDDIRENIDQPVYVLSGYRCQSNNREVGGVPNSQHVEGTACDLTYDNIDVDHLAGVAEVCGADGIGKYWSQGFVHVDVRGEPARWTEND